MTILNINEVDLKNQPMFLGDNLGLQRYDVFKYPHFEKLTKTQLSYYWRPEEINLQKDIGDYKKISEVEKNIFTNNLKYQILLDSVQGRGPGCFLPYVSLPELESAINIWQTMEMIHSRSYTYIIKNLYSDPSIVFDSIIEDEAIIKRSKSVTKYYDSFISYCNYFNSLIDKKPYVINEFKKRLLLAIVNIYILEGIRFYTSFASSFAFGENKVLEGSAKIISLIARDENIHMSLTSYIIRKWKNDEFDMRAIFNENKDNIIKMMDKAVEEELVWASYLFKDGSLIGLNEVLCSQYIKYLATDRLKRIGINKKYGGLKKSPLPWMRNWLESYSIQLAPQETEIESYIIGSIKQDKVNFDGFEL